MIARPPAFAAEVERDRQSYWRRLEDQQWFLGELYDGARAAFGCFDGPRLDDGLPRDFHAWPEHRREAWRAGYSAAFAYQMRLAAERDDEAGA